MSFLGLLIGTGILWVLNMLAVQPLAWYLTSRHRLNTAGVSVVEGAAEVTERAVDTKMYIIADVLVLGVVGFALGLVAGWFFIGIAWESKSWPGMLVFIGSSILGSLIHG